MTDREVNDLKVGSEGAGFDTRAGTRGSRRTSSPLQRRLDRLAATKVGRRVYRRLMRCEPVMLTTIGRKSGVERRTPVGGFPGDDGSWVIVASAGGTAVNPAWYYNIAAHPDIVRIEVNGREIAVTAEQLHGAERAEAWERVIAVAPQFASFQRKTDRVLPVIRLTPRNGDSIMR